MVLLSTLLHRNSVSMSQLLAMIAILYLCCGLAESNGDQLQRSEIVDRTSPSISDSRNSGTANVRKIRAIKSCKRSSVTPTTILATTASPTVTAASARSASLSTTTTQTLPSSSVISTTTQSVPPSSITSTSTASPSTTSLPVGDPSSFTTFQSEALAQTNSHRTVHCAPNLILNESLNAIAQAYAENIAATRSRVHSGNGYGENLWYKGSSHAINITLINGKLPAKSTADEW